LFVERWDRHVEQPSPATFAAVTFAQFRKLCLALPEAEELETWGEATFRVRGRIFAMGSPEGSSVSVKLRSTTRPASSRWMRKRLPFRPTPDGSAGSA
jgi:hypothetical protein